MSPFLIPAIAVSLFLGLFAGYVVCRFFKSYFEKSAWARDACRIAMYSLSACSIFFDIQPLTIQKIESIIVAFCILTFGFGFNTFLYFGFRRTEEKTIRLAQDNAVDAENRMNFVKTQRDIHTIFSEGISRSVSGYLQLLRDFIPKAEVQDPEKMFELVEELGSFETVAEDLLRALREATSRYLPADSHVVCTLFFENEDGLLEPCCACGADTHVVKEIWSYDKARFFKYSGVSSAAEAARVNSIIIDPDTTEAHDDHEKSFHYLGQRDKWPKQMQFMQSLATIPISYDPDSERKILICISSRTVDAIDRPEISWLVHKLKDAFEPRFRLLFTQKSVFELLSKLPAKQKVALSNSFNEAFQKTLDFELSKMEDERVCFKTAISSLEAEKASLLTKNGELTRERTALKRQLTMAKNANK